MILGLDTSATTCAVCLYSDRVLWEFSLHQGPTHSQTLLPAIKEALEKGNTDLSQLDAIAVSVGPGSFTGLRIGISTVKGLAFADNIPCIPVSTLEGLAMNGVHLEGHLVCPVMDARRGEFYNALFRVKDGALCRITEDRAVLGEHLAKELWGEKNILLLGDGAEKFVNQNPAFSEFLAPPEIRFQSGVSVAKLGILKMNAGEDSDCRSISPRYLRLPQAEREWLEKNKKKEK